MPEYMNKNDIAVYRASHATNVKTDKIIEALNEANLLDYYRLQIDFLFHAFNLKLIRPECTARAFKTIHHFENRISELC